MPTNVPDEIVRVSWWWWILAYWFVSFPVAVMLGRLLRYGSHELPDDRLSESDSRLR